MPSRALAGLSDRLRDIDELMAAHAARAGTLRGRRYDVAALNRASVLLLSAHLEGYLEDLMAEAIHAIDPQLNPARVNAGFANPKPDRIDDLFGFLGLSKPSNAVKWRNAPNARVKQKLRDLVDARNRIAHGRTGVRVLKDDVTSYRRYVEGFAKEFDDLVQARVQAITGQAPW
jgi:hypothetical protein